MIDTIRISVYREFNESAYEFLLLNTNQNMNGYILNSRTKDVLNTNLWSYRAIEYEKHETIFVNGHVHIPTHEYNIHYRCFEDRIDIEFSLPKFIYGTNVIMLYDHLTRSKSPYELLMMSIKRFFEYVFPVCKIDLGAVEIKRWDFCFNQIFKDEDEALRALKYIKLKVASKHDRLSYETGIVELSKSKYLKIYHKGAEFKKHDFYKMKNPEMFLKMAESILRYERKITPKNIAYWYNTKYKFQYQPMLVKEYIKQKNSGKKINKFLRMDMEKVQRFTLGNSKILDCTKLESWVFNHIYDMFRTDIKRKYEIGKMSLDTLKNQVINNEKQKVTKVKILAYIKTFKSLKRAYEMGAITKPTYYRYNSLMNELGLSVTNIRTEIKQDWSTLSYYSALARYGIAPSYFARDQKF
jgi:hypothetical protein